MSIFEGLVEEGSFAILPYKNIKKPNYSKSLTTHVRMSVTTLVRYTSHHKNRLFFLIVHRFGSIPYFIPCSSSHNYPNMFVHWSRLIRFPSQNPILVSKHIVSIDSRSHKLVYKPHELTSSASSIYLPYTIEVT